MIGHFIDRDRVAPPHLVGIDVEPGRDGVDQPLAHEGRLIATGSAVSGRRRLVGETKVADRAIGRHPVGTRQDTRRHVHDARGMGAHIGALVVKIAVIDGEDAAFAIDRRAQAVELLARMIGRDQMLAPVLDPFHRPVEAHGGDADQHIFRIEFAADAEASAHMRLVHVNRRRRALEHAREQLAIAVRHLGGAVQCRLRIRDSPELAWQDWLGSASFDRPEDYWPKRWAEAYLDFAVSTNNHPTQPSDFVGGQLNVTENAAAGSPNPGSRLWTDFDRYGSSASAYVFTFNMFTFPIASTGWR